jgi:hypothetical protein
MTPEELEDYYRSDAEDKVYARDLGGEDRTLTTGYELDHGGDVHVYLMDGEIHWLLSSQGRIVRHESNKSFPAHHLRPSKRAYPHTTDPVFAQLMRQTGEPLAFLGRFDWNHDRVRTEMAMEPFKGPTHLD